MATSWHLGRMAPFDLETTGVDPENARVVEAYVGRVGGSYEPVDCGTILVNPGIEVPDEAAKIHGYTTEFLREHGDPADAAVHIVASWVAAALQEGVPLVGHNISYDLTVLDRECRRYGLPTLEDRTGGLVGPVIDTLVLSKHVDPYRKRVSATQGAHQLKTCAQVFRVGWEDTEAHSARYDAMAAARVAWRIGAIAQLPRDARPQLSSSRNLFDALAVDLPDLFTFQKRAKATQDADFADYLRKQNKPTDGVVGHWPYTPYTAAVTA